MYPQATLPAAICDQERPQQYAEKAKHKDTKYLSPDEIFLPLSHQL